MSTEPRLHHEVGFVKTLRAVWILTAFALFTVPLMPIQWVLVKIGSPAAAMLPHWYHRRVARIFGLRITTHGSVDGHNPTLLAANHVSWVDIIVLSAVAPLSFVAKKEVARWPFAGSLARLQRTVFVDRERRTSLKATSEEIAHRLRSGEKIVIFPEGTSGDGNRILPFKSSLFAAVRPTGKGFDATSMGNAQVQTVAIAYTHVCGLPLGRIYRPLVAWYGEMALAPHAWNLLRAGPLDVHISIGDPVPLETFADRKTLTQFAESEVGTALAALLTIGLP